MKRNGEPPRDDDSRLIESREFIEHEPGSSPDGMKLLINDEAETCELARRQILDLFRSHGYRLIDPPVVDSLESLFSTVSPDLKNKTIRAFDPEDGRPLGIRVDITPQIARVDARQMDHSIPQRYAYCGCVIHGQRDHVGLLRNPYQIGVEMFGVDNIQADSEIISLAVETCRLMGFDDLILDIGHLGMFNTIFERSGLHPSLRHPLFALMQTKSQKAVDDFLLTYHTADDMRRLFTASVELHGGVEVLDRARDLFDSEAQMTAYLDYLNEINDRFKSTQGLDKISFDLINVNSYSYEQDLVFILYSPRSRYELIRGGRYNNIGDAFGRPRGAVGFSGFLHNLISIGQRGAPSMVYAPYQPENERDDQLDRAVAQLRSQSRIVVRGLCEKDNLSKLHCTEQLIKQDNNWQVCPIQKA